VPTESERFVSCRHLTELLAVSRKTVYAWVNRGILPRPRKLGTTSRWYWPEVQDCLERLPVKYRTRKPA
jgi:predicted DNA-binding transcriptional regulator AlpA